jgi:3-oxoacyl-[acyl-carrier protein] reductase
MKLKDKVGIVTGAGRGVGKFIALAFAKEGARVVAAARTAGEIEGVVKEIKDAGGDALAVRTDISQEADVARMMEEAFRHYGSINILVNNAAVHGPFKPIEEISPDEWRRTAEINLTGLFLCCRAVIPYMKRCGGGKIINLLSAKSGMPMVSAYYSTKMAIRALTDSLAAEVRHLNIDVNGFHPGGVHEGMLGPYLEKIRAMEEGDPIKEYFDRWLKRVETGTVPPEIPAKLAVYLASRESDGVTGNNFSVYDKSFSQLFEES